MYPCRKGTLSNVYMAILKEAGKASENYTIIVTSTSRTPYDQARIIECTGVDYQKNQYRQLGKDVIDVYKELSDKKRIKARLFL